MIARARAGKVPERMIKFVREVELNISEEDDADAHGMQYERASGQAHQGPLAVLCVARTLWQIQHSDEVELHYAAFYEDLREYPSFWFDFLFDADQTHPDNYVHCRGDGDILHHAQTDGWEKDSKVQGGHGVVYRANYTVAKDVRVSQD